MSELVSNEVEKDLSRREMPAPTQPAVFQGQHYDLPLLFTTAVNQRAATNKRACCMRLVVMSTQTVQRFCRSVCNTGACSISGTPFHYC